MLTANEVLYAVFALWVATHMARYGWLLLRAWRGDD